MEPSKLVQQVIAICESVSTFLDTRLGYSEYCYQTLIKQLLRNEGIYCETEAPVNFSSKGYNFGWGKIDLLIRGKSEVIIIELKANVRNCVKAEFQLKRYLTHYETNLKKVGLLFMYNSLERCPVVKRVFR